MLTTARESRLPLPLVLAAAQLPVTEGLEDAVVAVVLLAGTLASAFLTDAAPVAAPVVCLTAIQFPKPPAVVKETRHRSLPEPPLHWVPLGNWTVSSCEPTLVGF